MQAMLDAAHGTARRLPPDGNVEEDPGTACRSRLGLWGDLRGVRLRFGLLRRRLRRGGWVQLSAVHNGDLLLRLSPGGANLLHSPHDVHSLMKGDQGDERSEEKDNLLVKLNIPRDSVLGRHLPQKNLVWNLLKEGSLTKDYHSFIAKSKIPFVVICGCSCLFVIIRGNSWLQKNLLVCGKRWRTMLLKYAIASI